MIGFGFSEPRQGAGCTGPVSQAACRQAGDAGLGTLIR
jgi:hypothetical protein